MEALEMELEKVKGSLEKSKKTGEYTLILSNEHKKKYVLSKYTPKEDMNQRVDFSEKNKETLWIFFGFTLGYGIEAVIEKIGLEAKILVIEPDETLLALQFENSESDKIRANKNIYFYSGAAFENLEKLCESLLDMRTLYNIEIVSTPAYEEMYLNYYKKVTNTILFLKQKLQMNKNTMELLSTIAIKNIIKNRYHIINAYDIATHKDVYKNIPAVIVASGPSLSKNIAYLKAFKGLNFTCGRSVSAVSKIGVEPDFVVSLDPQDVTYDTLLEKGDNDYPLIVRTESSNKVVRHNKGKQYFIDDPVKLSKSIIGLDIESLSIGGSVATMACSIAHYMGCNPIIFIGQDLAYTDKKVHDEACRLEDEKAIDETNITIRRIKGFDGQEVLSSVVFLTFKDWIEKFIQQHSETVFINATEGGAFIEGAMHRPFKEVVDEYKERCKPCIDHGEKAYEAIDIDKYMLEKLVAIKEICKLASKGEALSQELKEEFRYYKGKRQNKIDKLLKALSKKVDKKITASQHKDIVEFIFKSIYNNVETNSNYHKQIEETPVLEGLRVSEWSKLLYSSLKEALEVVIEFIQKEMEETKGE